ncbi:MAG: tetratricopeptide repeat protein [Bacteroidales bacterium]|nr:tetratricopeptide repeat protein [Bacteroidales bacterium]MBN2748289.1 tetratricopeptide repeat protein [Bacteroidales bacterium]
MPKQRVNALKKALHTISIMLVMLVVLIVAKAERPIDLDSINKLLASASDSAKLEILIEASNEIIKTDPLLANEYAVLAKNLAQSLGNTKARGKAELVISKSFYIQGDYKKALEVAKAAEVSTKGAQDSALLAEVYHSYSLIYTKVGDFKNALDYSQEALTIVGALKLPERQADLVREIGNIYFYFGESLIALDFYQKSLRICEDNNYEQGMSKALNNIGRIYSESNQFDKALAYLQKALKLKSNQKDNLSIANTLLNIGTIHYRQNKYSKAVELFDSAFSYYSSVNNSEGMSNTLFFIGKSHAGLGNTKRAEKAYFKAWSIAEKSNSKPILFSISQAQSDLYQKQGDYTAAFERLKKHNEIRDSVFSDEKRKLLMELEAKYQFQANQRQIELLSKEQALKESEQKKLFFWIALLGIAAAGLISITYLIYSKFRLKSITNNALLAEIAQRQKAEDELQHHYAQLEAIIEDRTRDLKVAKEKAEEADRLKTAFLANMSHEIRTPMNAILGFSNLLFSPNLNETEKSDFLKLIKANAENLMSLINDIIDISLIESGQIKILYSHVKVTDALTELLNVFDQEKNILAKNEPSIELEYEGNLKDLTLQTDKNRLRQILSNLIHNALKFTDKGTITIGFKKYNEEKILFYVKDTGIGVPKDKFEFIFGRFSKLDYSTGNHRVYAGTGLGLTICRQLIGLMGGAIWLNSEVGKGSTFNFTLPNKQVTNGNPAIPGEVSYNHSKPLEGKTILIAEDAESNYLLIRAILAKSRINLLWAKNGVEALAIYKQNPKIDLILMDIQMPIMNGIDAIKQIRSDSKKIPIIVQTAFVFNDEMERGIKAGANDYITKPIRKEELLMKISYYLV